MRLSIFVMAMSLIAGCKTPFTGNSANSCDVTSSCGGMNDQRCEKPGGPQIIERHHYHYESCPSAQCKPPEKPLAAPPPAPVGAPPEQKKEAIVTQDILLIPRMVYVPYAPQVPVAPARLGTVLPAGRPLQECPPTNAPLSQDKLGDTLDKTLSKLEELNKRLSDLEAKTQTMPCPAPTCPAPCPTPGPGLRWFSGR
jgi:hypothetical protein